MEQPLWWVWLVGIIGVIAGLSTLVYNFIKVGEAIPRRKFTKWGRRHKKALSQYFDAELHELLGSSSPGSTQFKVRDLVEAEDLFIPPPWHSYPAAEVEAPGATPAPSAGKLQEYLVGEMLQKERVLLLGDPGQGKSTLLKRVYYDLVRRFRDKSSEVAPLYVPCRDLSIDLQAGRGVDALYEYLHTGNNPLLLSLDEFRAAVKNKLFAFLFDGFDEIHGELNHSSITRLVNSDIFINPGVLACRTHFYEFHLAASPLDTEFPNKVCLLPLEQEHVERYVAQVCARQRKGSMAGMIAEEIRSDSKLGDLSKRLLLLVMMTDMYAAGVDFREGQWNKAKLYREYTRNWLKNEASKSRLGWRDKSELLEDVAWEIFTAMLPSTLAYGDTQNLTISNSEIRSLLTKLNTPARYNLPLADVVDDICAHSCLATSGETYYFAHRSFQEYFVGRHVLHSMQANCDRALDALNQPLPAEIALFLKDMLQMLTPEKDKVAIVTRNLTEVYQAAQASDAAAALITREQAGYYLSRLKTPRVEAFLEAAIRTERDKWVKRGLTIGLIYNFRRRDILEAYMQDLHSDSDADLINLRYHLEYYGDQPSDGDHRYRGYSRCDRTVGALLRHLSLPEDHRIGWPLDLLTIRRLLHEAGPERHVLADDNVQFLREFLHRSAEEDALFEAERQALLEEMKEQRLL
jgi:hypothetical protein